MQQYYGLIYVIINAPGYHAEKRAATQGEAERMVRDENAKGHNAYIIIRQSEA